MGVVSLLLAFTQLLCRPNSRDDYDLTKFNKCIGDDTKAAARQSLNCIKNAQKST